MGWREKKVEIDGRKEKAMGGKRKEGIMERKKEREEREERKQKEREREREREESGGGREKKTGRVTAPLQENK